MSMCYQRKLENLIRCVLLALHTCGFHLCDLQGYSNLGNNRLVCLKMPEAGV